MCLRDWRLFAQPFHFLFKSVCRCSHTRGRNSCSIVSGDVSNCSYRLEVHPLTSSRVSSAYHFFRCEKHSKPRGNRAASASVYFNGQRPAIVTSGAGRHGWLAQTHRIAIRRRRCVCVRGCTRSCGCVRACVRACVRDVFTIYDNNIWPRLIMIIINNIILYFIQIRPTDDFPQRVP